MLKVLIKKQLMELFNMYFVDRKTGKARSKNKMIMYFCMFAAIIIYIGVIFYSIASTLANFLCTEGGMPWLYYAVMGILSVGLGVFGSVFNTYSGLYHAKDNELLLSMPIPTKYIIASRLAGTYLMSLIYDGCVFVPAYIARIQSGNLPVRAMGYVFPLINVFTLGFVVMAITCVLGWIISTISAKLKNKNIFTVLLSLAFFGGYYYVWFNVMNQENMIKLAESAGSIGNAIKSKFYIFYALGDASEGGILSMIIFTVFAVVLLAAVCFAMSKNFIKIATSEKGESKGKAKAKEIKVNTVKKTLLMKEYGRFFSSANYMLNAGMGFIFMIAFVVAVVWKGDALMGALSQNELIGNALPVYITLIVCMLICSCDLAAPSISLEGKSIWILQSMPVDPIQVLSAKAMLQFSFATLPAVIVVIVASAFLKIGVVDAVLMCLMAVAFSLFAAEMGVMLNLKSPNLEWTSELIPIKQGVPVFVSMIGGMALCALLGVGYTGLSYVLPNASHLIEIYLGIMAVLSAFLAVIIKRWINTKGAKIFATL